MLQDPLALTDVEQAALVLLERPPLRVDLQGKLRDLEPGIGRAVRAAARGRPGRGAVLLRGCVAAERLPGCPQALHQPVISAGSRLRRGLK
jgi:hypothetical protein